MPVSLRLPATLAHSLDKLAKSTDRPRSYLIRKALETYLAEHADYETALERLRERGDAVISRASLRKRLGV